jgi:hypothetical protein
MLALRLGVVNGATKALRGIEIFTIADIVENVWINQLKCGFRAGDKPKSGDEA